MTNPKCLGTSVPDTFDARSADFMGLKMRRITRAVSSLQSFDHLVGGNQQLVGHGEAEHPGGLGVDDQLELGRLYDRQVRGFGALEDATGINADLTIHIHNVASVGHQPAGLDKFTVPIYRGEPVAPSQEDELDTPSVEECVV